MKNYLLKNNNNLKNAQNEILQDLNKDFDNLEISTKHTYGDGVIKSIDDIKKSANGNLSISATIQFNEKVHQFLLDFSVNSGFITFKDESKLVLLNEYIEEIKKINEELNAILRKEQAEQEKKHQQEVEEQQKLERIKKAEIKAEQLKKSQLETAKRLDNHLTKHIGNEYYYMIGWIAKHAKNFVAAMPDYLDQWFVNRFGNVPHRSVDQSKLSPSGLPAQFALYFKIELDTNENIPTKLLYHLGDVNKDIKPISDTQFIYDIMVNEGFVFGKAKDQDLDKILDKIPVQFLDDFHQGYAN